MIRFQNNTNYSNTALKALIHMRGKSVAHPRDFIVRVVCLVLGLAALIGGYYFNVRAETYSPFLTLLLAYGALSTLYALFFIPYHVQIMRRSVAFGITTSHTEFEEEEFRFPLKTKEVRQGYGALQAIVENDVYFALFLNDKDGIIIQKSGFTLGDAEAFGPFLAEKTGLTIQKV